MSKNDNILVGLDIGTSKIACVVAEAGIDNRLDIIGIGTHPSHGLRKGVVVNIESTVESIRMAVEEAQLMAGVEIHSVLVGIAGSHIRGYNSHGVVATRSGEVTVEDVARVIDAARAMNIPADQKIVHILPQEYVIDGQDGIREPVGMSGVRLETKVHIVTCAVSAMQNLIKCCNRCGLDVNDMVLEQIASSESVLTQDEKDVGVALIDIGGGTSDIAIFTDGAIRHTAVIPIGGDHLTNDLVVGLHTSHKEADQLKRRYGACLVAAVGENEMIEVPSVAGRASRSLQRQVMAQILEPRVEELFELIRNEVKRSGYRELLAGGVVLTGGSSLLPGMVELAEDVLEMHGHVRLGKPQHVGGLADVVSSPIYATAVGLVQYGHRFSRPGGSRKQESPGIGKLMQRVRAWFGDT